VSDLIAAIDLGSNSFHMIVARVANGHLQIVDRLREMVQLRAGLDSSHWLSEEAQQRALDCLARFGQRLRHIPASRVRIVGTNTLRKARNSQEFLARAETLLEHPVEIISGREEARLIYLGVAHSTAPTEGQRLVVDIGGGSTELIIGEHFESLYLESLGVGCVSLTLEHFPEGKFRESHLKAAELAVSLELEPVTLAYQELGWNRVIGASGTIKAIRDVVVGEGWCREGITLAALRKLRNALLDAGKIGAIADRWQLEPGRARVFIGGFTVLHGLCEALGVEELQVSDGALREGVIYDLIGRLRHEDVRHRTVAALNERYGLDEAQAERVTATALNLLEQVKTAWGLEDEEFGYDLEWAARLHEIGLVIAHSNYHKHGAYVLQHADLPGFSRSGQGLLAMLVRGHRRKFPRNVFAVLPKGMATPARRLCVLLRMAVLLHRSRSRRALPTLTLRVDGQNLDLIFPAGWLEERALTRADLEREVSYLKKAGFQLTFAQADYDVELSLAK
jgi:exopolyphosphatase/guanosine-5'-triphosphate,3'-diphosphate pyrophosphatase